MFFTLKGWFEDHTLYHKIGYLIACGKMDLRAIYSNYVGKNKDEVDQYLDTQIKASVAFPDGMSYFGLSYENNNALLRNILLLFNVVSVARLDRGSQRFSFREYKSNNWSLEHINAQQSKPLVKLAEWKEWLRLHKPYIERLNNSKPSDNGEQLLNKVDHLLRLQSFAKIDFDKLQADVIDFLGEGDVGQMHTLDNLALLSCPDNAALSNSVFAVKRDKIIEMDKKGQFIPHCAVICYERGDEWSSISHDEDDLLDKYFALDGARTNLDDVRANLVMLEKYFDTWTAFSHPAELFDKLFSQERAEGKALMTKISNERDLFEQCIKHFDDNSFTLGENCPAFFSPV